MIVVGFRPYIDYVLTGAKVTIELHSRIYYVRIFVRLPNALHKLNAN